MAPSQRQGRRPAAPRRSLLFLAAGIAALLLSAAPALGQPVAAPPAVLDGPSAGITAPTGLSMSIARDGTGGLVYLKQVAGVSHAFVSPLVGGTFQPPVQVDAALPGASSEPVIAAGYNGALIVAFVNAGNLYVVQRASAVTGLSAARVLAAGGLNPSLQMTTTLSKAYLAFTIPDGGGYDVRAAYYFAGRWGIESSPLNVTPADSAGIGSARPAVAASNDGVGIVAWGEAGHVFSRRVWGTAPSTVYEQADAPLSGCADVSADEPAIGTGGDSSYAAVAFHETLDCGGQTESRVLYSRLHGSRYDAIQSGDALPTPAGDNADNPSVAVGEYGHGWVTSTRTGSPRTVGMVLGSNEARGGGLQVNGTPQASQSYPVPILAGFYSSAIVWQQDPGAAGVPDIRIRIADNNNPLGAETVLSSPSQGPTTAAAGLTGAGNVAGEVAVAWVQSTPSGNEIVTAQLYQPPSAGVPAAPTGYVRTGVPSLAWTPSSELWGPVRYTVTLDGGVVGQTAANALRVPTALGQGPHTWTIVAGNPAGQASATRSARFFVDTVKPKVHVALSGRRLAGSLLHLHVTDTDAPPPLPSADASGIAQVVVHWGDRTTSVIGHWRYHVYRKAGRYHLTVVAVDRAGNRTTVTTTIVVHAKPKPTTPAKGGH